MSIKVDPSAILRKISPKKKIDRLISKRKVSLKRTALSFVDDLDFLSKKSVTEVALKTIREYKKRIKKDPSIKDELVDDPKQLIQRVQNEVVFQVSQEIRRKYRGAKYTWLPSDADEPDPRHQLNYGKVFTIGRGEMPGERYGCRCGMLIHVEESELKL